MKPHDNLTTGARLSLAALLLSLVPASAGAQEADTRAELARLLDDARVEVGAPGGIVGILPAGGVPLVAASGTLDLPGTEPMLASQPFYLGSVSKTYTAAVVLKLVELGLVSLDDSIDRWLPSFPRGAEISVRQLLGHTSGLKDFYTYLYYRPDRDEMVRLVTAAWTEPELLELAGRFGHWFEPGTDWSYSNANYYLLGVIAQRASGLDLTGAYAHYLYRPLGISHTWLALHEPARGSVPTGYLGPVEGWSHAEMFGTLGATTVLDASPVEWGAGGLVAPAADALVFLDGLMRGRLLSPALLDAMRQFRPTPPLGGASPGDEATASEGYGLGLVRMSRNGFEVVGHGGLFTGHTAGLWFVADCDITVAFYFNRGFIRQREFLDELLEAVSSGRLEGMDCRTSDASRVEGRSRR